MRVNHSSKGQCTLIKKNGCGNHQTIFIIGDSHAAAYVPMLQQVNKRTKFDIVMFSGGGCSFLNFITPTSQSGESCSLLLKSSFLYIKKESRPGDILFLPSLRLHRFGDQWALIIKAHKISDKMKVNKKNIKLAAKETKEFLGPLIDHKLHIIFEGPKPIFFSPAFRCSDWFNKMNPNCSLGLTVPRNFLLNYRRPIMDSIKGLVASNPFIHLWDPFFLLCPGEVCSVFRNGRPLFFDGDHLSRYGNEVLTEDFLNFISRFDISNK